MADRSYNRPYDGYEPSEVLLHGKDWSARGFALLVAMFFTPGNSTTRWLAHNQLLRQAREAFTRANNYGRGSRLQDADCWIDPGY